MAAFELAIESGADGIEFDVRLTCDEIPVVIHDETLQRTAGVTKRIADHTYDELQSFDVGSWFRRKFPTSSRDFSGETIPALKSLLQWALGNSAKLYLEMKSDASRRQALAESVCSLLSDFNIRERVVIECFDLEAIKIVKALDSKLKTAALFEPSIATPPRLRSRRLIELAKASSADEIALHHRLVNRRIVEQAHAENLATVVWTVDDPSWIDNARDLKLAAVITNRPRELVDQRNRSASS